MKPLVSLSVDMTDVYPATHWARTGQAPGYHTPDEDVYLPGRNIVLLGKAGVFCAAAGIDRLVIGTLDHNPFPDATSAVPRDLGGRVIARARAPASTSSRRTRGSRRRKSSVARPRSRAVRAHAVVHEPLRSRMAFRDTAGSAANAASDTTRFSRPGDRLDPTDVDSRPAI